MIRLRINKMEKKPGQIKTHENRKEKQKKLKRLNTPHIYDGQVVNICGNFSCRLRKAGCRGFEGCPGYLAK